MFIFSKEINIDSKIFIQNYTKQKQQSKKKKTTIKIELIEIAESFEQSIQIFHKYIFFSKVTLKMHTFKKPIYTRQ